VSGGVAPNICSEQNAGGFDLGFVFAICDAACAEAAAGGSTEGVNDCIAVVDCINNGGHPTEGEEGWECSFEGSNCHENEIWCPDAEPICYPQESAQPGDCKGSRSSDCTYADGDCD
jgi:hypothetical protein